MASSAPNSSWLHMHITGREAEAMLQKDGKQGSFIMRPSKSRKNDFTLSCMWDHQVQHIAVQQLDDAYDVYGGEQFATLPSLVDYLKLNGMEQKNGKGVIKLMCPYTGETHNNEKWYHGNLSGGHADRLLKEDGKIGCFLIRNSNSEPGNYVLSVLVDKDTTRHVKVETVKKEGKKGATKRVKYGIKGADHFLSLTDFVEFHKKNDLADKTQTTFRLREPCETTKFRALTISDRSEQSGYEKQMEDEYEELLRADPNFPTIQGAKKENRLKNRYKNILPFDHSRVRLKISDPGEPESDYVNANYVHNKFNINSAIPYKKRTYIASQGCLPKTLNSFWDMIWQEDVRVLIMATRPIENGKFKSAEYWPKSPTDNIYITTYHGDICVKLDNEEKTKDHVVRKIKLSKGEGEREEVRTVYQYHYMSWPDHGVPDDPGVLLEFLQSVNRQYSRSNDKKPMMVHCSAGIGRTGTIIVIDIILNQIEQFGLDCEIDILAVCKQVRHQRPGMIQTQSQYNFVYSAIKQHVLVTKAKLEKAGGEENTYCNTDELARGAYENVILKKPEGIIYENFSNGLKS